MTQERPWTAQDAPQESIKLAEESLRRHPKRPQRTPGRPTAGVGRKPRTVPAHLQSRCRRRLGPEDPAPTNSPARQEKLEIQKTRSWCIRHPGVFVAFPGKPEKKSIHHTTPAPSSTLKKTPRTRPCTKDFGPGSAGRRGWPERPGGRPSRPAGLAGEGNEAPNPGVFGRLVVCPIILGRPGGPVVRARVLGGLVARPPKNPGRPKPASRSV